MSGELVELDRSDPRPLNEVMPHRHQGTFRWVRVAQMSVAEYLALVLGVIIAACKSFPKIAVGKSLLLTAPASRFVSTGATDSGL